MLDRIKKAIGVSHNAKDDVYQAYIDAGIEDARNNGVSEEAMYSHLGFALILTYVKAEIDFEGKGERFRENYEKARDTMSLSENYKENTDVR